MIGLLVDAAIAVVIVLDRLCAAVEKAARPPVIPPDRSADAPPAGTGSPASAASAGGHLNLQRHEPLVWGDHYIPHN